jgi:AbiV family abortive infection protein
MPLATDQLIRLQRACLRNAQQLIGSAKLVLANRHRALAVSLCIAALEEIGRMFLTDGLANARLNDERHLRFIKGRASHKLKLQAAKSFPIFHVMMVAQAVDFYKDSKIKLGEMEKRHWATAKRYWRLRERMNDAFQIGELDEIGAYRSKGIYVDLSLDDKIIIPQKSITPQQAKLMLEFADLVVSETAFLMGNFRRYKAHVMSMRRMNPSELAAIRKRARAWSAKFTEQTE